MPEKAALVYLPPPSLSPCYWSFPKCFIEFKIFVITVKGLQPATSCERDQDATTAPARHM